MLSYRTYGDDIICISRKIDFLPAAHSFIARAIHQHNALACQKRGGMGYQGLMPVLVGIGIIQVFIVKGVIT